jgi:hypothetical protein
MNAVQEITGLPRDAARMLAVEILLAEPESLDDDVLESCLISCGRSSGRRERRRNSGVAPAAGVKAATP